MLAALSCDPTTGDPPTTGSTVFAGAVGATTTAETAEDAPAEPWLFEAVTTAAPAWPTAALLAAKRAGDGFEHQVELAGLGQRAEGFGVGAKDATFHLGACWCLGDQEAGECGEQSHAQHAGLLDSGEGLPTRKQVDDLRVKIFGEGLICHPRSVPQA